MRDFENTYPYRTPAQQAQADAEFERLLTHLLPKPEPLTPPIPPDVEPPQKPTFRLPGPAVGLLVCVAVALGFWGGVALLAVLYAPR
jgi:hypothetical protein